ncbi:MAG: ECF transporter S component [Nitrospirota bacterium]
MHKTSTLTINKVNILSIIKFAALIGVATIVPLFHFQPVTGPIVNATLFIAAATLGAQSAILVGLIPSIIALSSGLLPPVLAPMIPFIMLSNAILIMTYSHLAKQNYWLNIALASTIKFLFLFATSSVVINLLLQKEIADTVALMMSWPQLVTALAGGIIAYPIIKLMKK